jgi:hypothetical protein
VLFLANCGEIERLWWVTSHGQTLTSIQNDYRLHALCDKNQEKTSVTFCFISESFSSKVAFV